MTGLSTAALALHAIPALAGHVETTLHAATAPPLATTFASAGASLGQEALAQAQAWLGRMAGSVEGGYARAPALVVGIGFALMLPMLALAGLVLHRIQRRRTDAALAAPPPPTDIETTRAVTEGLAWPADAFLSMAGASSPKPIGRELLRIGREDDNDLCLTHPTVHRYHAVVRRTPESDFIVVDLSARDGNGVLLNGRRVAQARLRDGDVIGLGAVELRFETRPA